MPLVQSLHMHGDLEGLEAVIQLFIIHNEFDNHYLFGFHHWLYLHCH